MSEFPFSDAFIDEPDLKDLERNVVFQLLHEHIDGALLIDVRKGKLIPVSDEITGKLKSWIDFPGLSYARTISFMLEKAVDAGEEKFLRSRLELDNLASKLKSFPSYSVDFKYQDGDKAPLFKRLRFFPYRENGGYIVASCEDVTLEKEGDIDPLTGLLDTSGFHEHVAAWIADHPGKKYRIQRYNIDHFRDINGIYGHEAGDQLLKDFGAYMKRFDSPESFSAHLNADHFVRFCPEEDAMSPEEYARLIPLAFTNYHLSMPINVHVGVYDLCEEDNDSFVMAYKALLALQTIKGDHLHSLAYYKKGMMKEEVEEQEFLSEADEAIKEGQFEVWYQPQVDYLSGKLLGAEALIRWRHPVKGLLPPGRFLPLFERTSKIASLDQETIRKVCLCAKAWQEKYPTATISFSCNLSRSYLLSPTLPSFIDDAVFGSDLPSGAIHFEITESAYAKDSIAIENVVESLHGKGFTVEMDDFGSAYSSLNSLKSLHVDVVKLDMKFLSGGNDGERGRIILASVIEMVKKLGMDLIAEGVETKEQADMLLSFGCEKMQGYYFSKPVPEEEYKKMLSGEMSFPKAEKE